MVVVHCVGIRSSLGVAALRSSPKECEDCSFCDMASLGRLRSLFLPLRQNVAKSMLPAVWERPTLLPFLHRDMSSSSDFSGAGEKEPPPAPGTFGYLLAQSGLTEDALDSLIALKDFTGIEGLPPLELIEEMDPEGEKKAMRREIERLKQEEIDKTRVKTVDEFGRAYATGKRKESIARVWLYEGQGKFTINGKAFDNYFPDIANRVHMLEPFVQTSTLGAFDVRSTVKGGGTTGQSGAIRHGISKALQLFDPNLRPALKSAGMLTRDSRVVERKKPGKAKARKSYQWVKR